MKVLILGLGLNGGGKAASEYFNALGDEVRISDSAKRSRFLSLPDELEEKGIKCFFEDADPRDNILWADVVIKNPAIPLNLPQLSLAKDIETDFSYLLKSEEIKEIKFIAVTGTKGKTTTVAALTHALNTLGQEALCCGNIGVSAFTILNELKRRRKEGKKLPSYIVSELSSWQIHDTYIAMNGILPRFTLAILTSIYPDHLNSYRTLASYKEDKLKLFGPHCDNILVQSNIEAFFLKHTTLLRKRTHHFPSFYNPYVNKKMELQCAYDALKILGYKKRDIVKALNSYKGMPHRIEQVAIIDDVMYINDSAATISEAVSFTMKNIAPLPTHLICGGTDKSLKPNGMEKAIKMASSITLLDGSFTRDKLIPLLESKGIAYNGPFDNMRSAFEVANKMAREKAEDTKRMQVLLLSPGAASFGLFQNEFDRGNQFKDLVKELKN